MEDFANAIAHEVKQEIADRYFGFRRRIEAEIQNYLQRLHTIDQEITTRIQLDIRRMQFLLQKDRLFKAFLLVARLPERFTDDAWQLPTVTPLQLFAQIKGEGFTRRRRFRDLAFKVYLSLAANIAAYREAYLDIKEQHEDICTQIDDFHRTNDLPSILSFIRSFDTAEADRLKFLHSETALHPGRNLDQDLKISHPRPVDNTMPMLTPVPTLKQVKGALTELLDQAFLLHPESPLIP